MDDDAVMRQEPTWPAEESAQEFLMRTLSADQWKAISQILKDERQTYVYALLEVAEFTAAKMGELLGEQEPEPEKPE